MAKSKGKIIIFVVVLVLIVIQFIPVTRDNPPVTGDFTEPADVATILKRSCYDCHSNETDWPWYAWVAPVSWQVASDVHEARGGLNFSEWRTMNPGEQKHDRREIWEHVEEGSMPLPMYLVIHTDARLSDQDKETIRKWATATAAAPDSVSSDEAMDEDDDD